MNSGLWLSSLEKALRKQGSPVFEQRSKSGGSDILSAANLWTRALERKRLLTRAGFEAGDLICESSQAPDFLVTLVACAMAGGRFWPLNHADFLNHTLEASSPSPVRLWTASAKRCWVPEIYLRSLAALAPDTAIILRTSGSMGSPRLVGLSETALLHQIESLNTALEPQPHAGRLIILPLHHCFGLIADLLAGLFAQQTIFLRSHEKFRTSIVFDTIANQDIEHLSVVPRVMELLLLEADGDAKKTQLLSRLHVHVGGAMITGTLREKATAMFAKLTEGYGLTECAAGVLLDGRPNRCEVKLKKLSDETLNEIFELWVKSPSLGSFADSESRLDSEGYLHTEDLARLLPDGRIEVLGRRGEFFKDQNGVWTSSSLLVEKIYQALGVTLIGLNRRGTDLEVALQTSQSFRTTKIVDFIRRRYGFGVRFHYIEDGENISQILSLSTCKSKHEALADWLEKKLCA